MTLEELLANDNLRRFLAAGENAAVRQWTNFHPEYQFVLHRFNQQLYTAISSFVLPVFSNKIMPAIFSIIKEPNNERRNNKIDCFRKAHEVFCVFLENHLPDLQEAADAFAKNPTAEPLVIDNEAALQKIVSVAKLAFQETDSLNISINYDNPIRISVTEEEGGVIATFDATDPQFTSGITLLQRLKNESDHTLKNFAEVRRPELITKATNALIAHATKLKQEIRTHCHASLKQTESWFLDEKNQFTIHYENQKYSISAFTLTQVLEQTKSLKDLVAHATPIVEDRISPPRP